MGNRKSLTSRRWLWQPTTRCYQNVLGKSPRVSTGASLLSFSLNLRTVLKFCEGARSNKVFLCKYLSWSSCMAVGWLSQKDCCLWDLFFSTHFHLLMLVERRMERILESVFSVYLHRKLHLSPLERCPFCFPFVAFSLSSFNTTKSPATRDHCFFLTSRVSRIKIPWSKSLINASLHHRLQFLKIGHRYLLVNLHFVQFQYGFELRGVMYSQFVQTFLEIIGRKLWHW